MKLTVETIKIENVQFGSKTKFEDNILYVNKQDIFDFAKEEECIETLNIDIARPKESARIINVVDVVQPRCKMGSGSDINWPGVLTDEYKIAGNGRTRAVEGMGIVLCHNASYWSRKWGSLDMGGPCEDINPYAMMPELIIEPIAPEADFRDHREAVKRIGLKTSVLLAKVTLVKEADKEEIFSIEKQYEDLPNIAYSFQFYSKQYDTRNYREPMFYNLSIADSLPIMAQPNEILDGAMTTGGGYRSITTYEIQNHPVILELMRRHGKDLNFVGTILTVTSVEADRRSLVSKMAASILKETFDADGVVITKGVGGASTLDVGAIASEAEKLGIKAVPIIQILNKDSNLASECLITEDNVDSIVQSGTYYHYHTFPPVDKLYGGPEDARFMGGDDGVIEGHKLATGVPAKGEVVGSEMKQVGMMSQIGNSHGKAVDY